MPMLIQCTDKEGHLQMRLDNRPTHLAYLEENKAKLLAGGAIMGGDGNPIGSVLIVDTEDAAEARTFADNDPFSKVGLFETVTVTPWRMAYFNYENKL